MADKTEPGSVHMLESNEDFKKYINESKGVVVLDAFAEWCGPCKMVAPHLAKWAKEFKDAKFYSFDVDKQPDIAQELGIKAMPTFIFYKDGEIEKTIVGAHLPNLEKTIVELTKV